jgi:hypothetical protein
MKLIPLGPSAHVLEIQIASVLYRILFSYETVVMIAKDEAPCIEIHSSARFYSNTTKRQATIFLEKYYPNSIVQSATQDFMNNYFVELSNL